MITMLLKKYGLKIFKFIFVDNLKYTIFIIAIIYVLWNIFIIKPKLQNEITELNNTIEILKLEYSIKKDQAYLLKQYEILNHKDSILIDSLESRILSLNKLSNRSKKHDKKVIKILAGSADSAYKRIIKYFRAE